MMFLHDEGGMHQVKEWPNYVLKTHRIEYLRKRNVNRVCVWGDRQKEVPRLLCRRVEGRDRRHRQPKFDVCLPDYEWVTAAEERRAKEEACAVSFWPARVCHGRARGGTRRPFPPEDESAALARQSRPEGV